MLKRPKTKRDVLFQTALAAGFSVVVTAIMVTLMFELENYWRDMLKGSVIALLCSIPVSWVLCNEMRKNEELNDLLRDLVNRDRLTDVATRDYFFTRMEEAPDSYGVSLMIDIDHFKSVNDTHGHLVGDQVIQRVAAVLRGTVRADDIVCRFGGEEFVVFLAKHETDQGFEVAERMRLAIEEEVIKLPDLAISVTVSIGGSLKDRVKDINLSIKEADDALYLAKRAGRNQTIFADDDDVADVKRSA